MSIHQCTSAGRSWGLLLTLFTALTISFSACKNQEDNQPKLSTITEIVNGGSRFTLLKAALVRTGLDGTLSQPGTYTIFAPTDDAFKLFGYGDAATISAAPIETLRAVLQYHVLGTRLESSAIPAAVNTAQQTLVPNAVLYTSKISSGTSTSASSTTLSVNGAHVLQADGQASNGVIYAIDRILLPPVLGNVVTTLQNISVLVPTASFKLLQAAVAKAGTQTAAALTATGPITVFAPTDAAFKAVGYDSAVIARAPAGALANVLSYHILNSRTYTPLITNGSSLTTSQGGTITAGISTTALTVTGRGNANTASNITGPDITATNGIVHIIDRLLIP